MTWFTSQLQSPPSSGTLSRSLAVLRPQCLLHRVVRGSREGLHRAWPEFTPHSLGRPSPAQERRRRARETGAPSARRPAGTAGWVHGSPVTGPAGGEQLLSSASEGATETRLVTEGHFPPEPAAHTKSLSGRTPKQAGTCRHSLCESAHLGALPGVTHLCPCLLDNCLRRRPVIAVLRARGGVGRSPCPAAAPSPWDPNEDRAVEKVSSALMRPRGFSLGRSGKGFVEEVPCEAGQDSAVRILTPIK